MSLETTIMTEIAALRASNERLAAKVESLERHVVPTVEWITAKQATDILCCSRATFYAVHHLHLVKRRGKFYHRIEVQARAAKLAAAKFKSKPKT